MEKIIRTVVGCAIALSLFQTVHADSSRSNPRLEPTRDRDFYANGHQPPAKVELGRNLFFDKILSGNFNIACASCHHALTDTGDGLSLSVGEGGNGLGISRDTGRGDDGVHERVPRNAPPLFNLGAHEFETMFHDGRVAVASNQPHGFLSPAGDNLPAGLDNVLAVQAMFPVTSGTEMAGQSNENSIGAAAAAGDLSGVWSQLAQRLSEIPAYVQMFEAVYDDIDSAQDITYVHAANAIAAFEASTWRSDNSPFDRYLRGDKQAMSGSAKKGMRVFYGKAGCGDCHSGTFQTDHQFYSIALPQIGPGKGDGASGHEDFGRERVSGNPADRFRFRVPSLRNVALTGPWGHDGAYGTLEAMVRHHLDPTNSLNDYDKTQCTLPSRDDLNNTDFLTHDNEFLRNAIADSSQLDSIRLRESDVAALMDFLHALTDPSALDLRHDMPASVPSGIHMYD